VELEWGVNRGEGTKCAKKNNGNGSKLVPVVGQRTVPQGFLFPSFYTMDAEAKQDTDDECLNRDEANHATEGGSWCLNRALNRFV
jgi:hypothetical protein